MQAIATTDSNLFLPSAAGAFGGAFAPAKIARDVATIIHCNSGVTMADCRWCLPIGAVVGQENGIAGALWSGLSKRFDPTEIFKEVVPSQILCRVTHEYEVFAV